jgi:hypothetical protein
VPDAEVLLTAVTIFIGILLLVLLASIRVVREGEFAVVFRLGRAVALAGAGLVVLIPLIHRAVRVAVPVGLSDLSEEPRQRRAERASLPQDVPNHPGVDMAEACFRAAMLASRRNPRTRKATAEDFQEALREIARVARRRAT